MSWINLLSNNLDLNQMCAYVLGYFPLVSSSPLAVTVFLSPLLQSSLILRGRGLVETSHLGPSSPRSLTLHRVQLWFSCICSHLLDEETSLMMLCSDPWAQQIVVRNLSLLCDSSRRGLGLGRDGWPTQNTQWWQSQCFVSQCFVCFFFSLWTS